MHPSADPVVAISARGHHVAPYDRVVFSVAVRERGATTAKARHAAAAGIERLATLSKAWERAGRATRQLAVTRVSPLWIPNKGHDGYEAVHDCVLRSAEVQHVNAMQDELTQIPKIVVQAPRFEFQDPEPFRRLAMKNAWARVRERLAFECELLGVPETSLAIAGWHADYDDRQRSVQKVAASHATEEEVAPGMAQISVSLTVRYAWKA